MKKIAFTLVIFLISLILLSPLGCKNVASQSNTPVRLDTFSSKPLNLDFEEGQLGGIPQGWFAPTSNIGYPAKLVEENPKTGKRCVMLFNDKAEIAPNVFGNVMQSIDANAFRGKRVKFSGAVRINGESNDARAQLWFRVDRNEQQVGFFDNMGDRPITSSEWKYYEIVADIDQDAKVINIGMILLGKGKAWLDSVSFEEVGALTYSKEPARPLTQQGLANVVAFTKLFGYIRHFHPSDEAANIDWNSFAINNIKIVEEAKNNIELAEKLNSVFNPIAPTVKVFPSGQSPELPSELNSLSPKAKFTYWRHIGFGNSAQKNDLGPYHSYRVQVTSDDKAPTPNKPFIGDLGAGLSCMVPMALYVDEKGTLPHTSQVKVETEPLIKYSGDDRNTRLANVITTWNILQHFYPYFDVVKVNWPQSLEKALLSAANDKDAIAFTKTLSLMIADLQDGHGLVRYSGDNNNFTLPIIVDFVEDKLVVTDISTSNNTEGLQIGDIITSIDNKPVKEVLAEKEALISGATLQWKRFNALRKIFIGAKDSEATLEIEKGNGQKKTLSLKKTTFLSQLEESQPDKVTEIKPGIFYLDLDRIKDDDFIKVLPKLEKAKGVIFDLRGYPNQLSPTILNHLIDEPVQSARWNVPIVSTPDHQNMVEFDTNGRWTLKPEAPKIKAKVAFITDGRAISYAESYMGIVEAYKLAEIVGAPTAGTNGNINPLKLPGDYTVIWTGMKVLKHDGSQHHGIGIQPTVAVSRTIKGITEKKDEFLEKAIEVVSK